MEDTKVNPPCPECVDGRCVRGCFDDDIDLEEQIARDIEAELDDEAWENGGKYGFWPED
jgi:hypothetical protein